MAFGFSSTALAQERVGSVIDIDGPRLYTNRLKDQGWFQAYAGMNTFLSERLRTDKQTQAVLRFLVGGLAGFFVVPMNALLQHRGHILMGAGHSIAVQNFNENLSILVMTGIYALLIMWGVSIDTVIILFGLFVAGRRGVRCRCGGWPTPPR